MLESSFLSSSWETEVFPDWNLQEVAFEDTNYLCSWDRDDIRSISTCDFSSSSSDIEGFNLDEVENNLLLTDSFVSQILGDNRTDTDCTLVDNFYGQSHSYPSSLSNTNANKLSKTKKLFDCTESSKSWSSMSAEEQEKSLISISEVTCQMGIREQLEVIRIMDPHIEISAEMKEFTLDVSLLNDSKWKRIQDYFKKHTISFPSQNASTHKSVKSRKTSKSSRPRSKKSNSSVSRTSRKQRQKKQKIPPEEDVFVKSKRKQEMQGMREEKSGLFVYEKVVKVSSLEDDEDVNILE